MIGKLTGLVDSSGEDWAVIDVSGVGYLVYCSARSLANLPGPGEPVTLSIETHVREDHIHLYGFLQRSERDWFRLLCTVQGVGSRMALAILSVLAPLELTQAIAAQDKAALTRANGVGPKLAGRIVAELKDKAGKLALGPVAALTGSSAAAAREGVPPLSEDAISALVNLGYQRGEAFGAVVHATRELGADAPLEAVIKAGLKELSA
jgi:Holliday junction DNA helicase RuvA